MLAHGKDTKDMIHQPMLFLGNILLHRGNDTTRNSISGGVQAPISSQTSTESSRLTRIDPKHGVRDDSLANARDSHGEGRCKTLNWAGKPFVRVTRW